MGHLKTDEGHPGWLTRLVVGAIGSAVPLVGPLVVKYGVFEAPTSEVSAAAHAGALAALIMIILAWSLSVFVTTYITEDHILKTVLGSLGIPGVVVSGAVGLQVIQ